MSRNRIRLFAAKGFATEYTEKNEILKLFSLAQFSQDWAESSPIGASERCVSSVANGFSR
jgi:hypothetical protein